MNWAIAILAGKGFKRCNRKQLPLVRLSKEFGHSVRAFRCSARMDVLANWCASGRHETLVGGPRLCVSTKRLRSHSKNSTHCFSTVIIRNHEWTFGVKLVNGLLLNARGRQLEIYYRRIFSNSFLKALRKPKRLLKRHTNSSCEIQLKHCILKDAKSFLSRYLTLNP